MSESAPKSVGPTPAAARLDLPGRRDPAVAEIARAWRARSGGKVRRDTDRRTLIACSGGADSSALAIVLRVAAARGDNLVLAHVVHDLRRPTEADADRDRAHELAERLGMAFAEARIEVAGRKGNAESFARKARYARLSELADKHGCPYVVTGHHADDQLETMLMAMVRGSGVRGMRGVAAARWLRTPSGDAGVRLIRPALRVTREDTERLCREAGWTWSHDRTNEDRSRLRAAVRAEVLPTLRAIRPKAAVKASDTAARLGEVSACVSDLARAVCDLGGDARDGELRWTRHELRKPPRAVLGEALRLGVARLGSGAGMDRLPARSLSAATKAVRSSSGVARSFVWSRVTLVVTREAVTLSRRADSGPGPKPTRDAEECAKDDEADFDG